MIGSAAQRACRRLLGRPRVMALCAILLAFEIACFVFFALGTYGLVVPLSKPTSTDFVSFYAAGRLADAGTPQLAYDQAAHYAAEQRAAEPGITYNFFYYPPVFLLLCAALAHLPYIPAFIAFAALTLVFYLLVMRCILGERGWVVLVPILAFPPVLWTLGFGQNGLLTAGLFGAATLLVDRRPWVAGLLFGALCYKPHFALLVPVALAAGGRWRAVAAAASGAAALGLLSLVVFGWDTWHAFFTALTASRTVYVSGRIPFTGFVTPFGAARLLGAAPAVAYAAQAGVTLAAGGFVAVVWRRDLPPPIRAASLASATLVAVPLALFYDFVLGGIAGAWLLGGRAEYRLSEWDKLVLAILYVLCLNPRGIAAAWQVPIGPLVSLGLVGLTAAIAFRTDAPLRLANIIVTGPRRPEVGPATPITGRGVGGRDTAAAG